MTYEDRRRGRRIALHTEALLRIALPEGSTVPSVFRGVAMDISAFGLRMKSYHLRAQDCEFLDPRLLMAEATLELPYISAPLKCPGTIMWARMIEATRSEPEHAMLAIDFGALNETTRQQIEYVIARLSGDSVDTVPKMGQ